MGAVTGGQMLLAGVVDTGAPLGGNPLGVVALCVAAGAVLALAMRAVRAARDLVPRAPRARLVAVPVLALLAPPALAVAAPLAAPARGRGPPAA
jgi:hypothetical protein